MVNEQIRTLADRNVKPAMRGLTLLFSCLALAAAATPSWATCPAAPDLSCRFSQSSTFSYADSTNDTKDKLSFKLGKATNTPIGDFGDPTTSDSYDLCIYANNALLLTLSVPADGDCSDDACWKTKTKGQAFKDKSGAHSGITAIALSTPADASDKTAVRLAGKGGGLPAISLPIAEPIAVQLRNSLGKCWGAVYSGAKQVAQDSSKGTAKLKTKAFPTCSDGLANGSELDVDCGGSCGSCGYQQNCIVDLDCSSKVCNAGQCDAKRVFVTSTTYTGNLSGVAGGDSLCNARAGAASLGGSWSAFLSTPSSNAYFHIGDHGYKRLDGALVFASLGEMDATGAPRVPINVNELGVASSGEVWTATNDTGGAVQVPGGPCSDWTVNTGSGTYGSAGAIGGWSYTAYGDCGVARSLYCFEN